MYSICTTPTEVTIVQTHCRQKHVHYDVIAGHYVALLQQIAKESVRNYKHLLFQFVEMCRVSGFLLDRDKIYCCMQTYSIFFMPLRFLRVIKIINIDAVNLHRNGFS